MISALLMAIEFGVRVIRMITLMYLCCSFDGRSPPATNGVARIFFLGGPPGTFSSPLRGSRPHSVGGGVVAEILPDRIQWGGGSSGNFRDLNYRIGFSGGGVVAEIFPVNKSITFPRFRDILGTFSAHLRIIHRLWALAEIQGHFPCLLTHSNRVTTSIHSGKKNLLKLWGGPWPPGPPPWLRHCPPR